MTVGVSFNQYDTPECGVEATDCGEHVEAMARPAFDAARAT